MNARRTLEMSRKIKRNEINQNDQQQSFFGFSVLSFVAPRASASEKGSPCAKKCQFLSVLMRGARVL
jgi:hypothetical protein